MHIRVRSVSEFFRQPLLNRYAADKTTMDKIRWAQHIVVADNPRQSSFYGIARPYMKEKNTAANLSKTES
jgi:hypothetical protein